MKRPLRVGLAGIGALYWPITIADGIKARRDAKLVSFSTLGVAPRVIKDHLGMEPSEHARLVQQIAPHGKDIFIATTFTTTMKDADAICSAEKKHGIRIVVGHAWDARKDEWLYLGGVVIQVTVSVRG
jgi:hypothetical protein